MHKRVKTKDNQNLKKIIIQIIYLLFDKLS